MSMSARAVISAFALAAVAHGCVDAGTNLRPAKAANQVEDLRNAAAAEDQGVRIVAQPAPVPGPAVETAELTPVRVRITNASDKPVRVRYSDFLLVAADGQEFAAVPPLPIEGDVPVDEAVVAEPGFTYSGFEVAPYLSGVYPTMGAWTGPFVTDVGYYDAYYGYWDIEAQLPTEEMVQRALPEGVVRPGGSVEGFLYFQEVTDDKEAVQFRAELAAADTGSALADITIPFVVMD